MATTMSINRKKQRRARRAVLLAVALFGATQIGFVAVVERSDPALVDAEFGTRLEYFRTLRRQYPRRKSIAVLGSSRIGNGFESDYATARSCIEDNQESPIVANMSMTGGTSVWQYLALRRLIDHGLKPDAVIVEIFPMTLVSDDQYFQAGYHFPPHRLRWGDIRSLSAIVPDNAWRHGSEWVANNAVFPWHTHRFSLVGLFAPKWQVDQLSDNANPRIWRKIVSPTGWIRFGVDEPTPAQRQKSEDVARSAYGPIGISTTISKQVAATYEALFACCREHGIEVRAVVMMPESEMFRGFYGPSLQQEVRRFAESVTHDHGIPVVDAREWIPAEQFWDGHHLLAAGARAFTDRICTETLGFKRTADLQRVASRPTVTPQ